MGPAGSIVTDPDFKCDIVRATDENTTTLDTGYSAGDGGSADVCMWNTDSTMLVVCDDGGGRVILGFNPTTLAVQRLFPSFISGGGAVFSKVNPNYLYQLSFGQLLLYDLTDRTATRPPTPTLVCDFSSLFPSKITWASFGGVELNDTVFSAGFSITGDQGTGIYVATYVVGKGFRLWNTSTGAVTGQWGNKGFVNLPDRFYVHNVKAAKHSERVIVSVESYMPGSPDSTAPYFWECDALQVIASGPTVHGGHWTGTEATFFNNQSPPPDRKGISSRTYAKPGTVTFLTNPSPSGIVTPLDDHLSYNGPMPAAVIFASTTSVGAFTSFPAAWYDEVLGFSIAGPTYRFCHTMNSGLATENFSGQNAIACSDQQNKFVAFTSDWMSARHDVYIVELR
jgi:hypothetical protein